MPSRRSPRATYPQIRLFTVEKKVADKPLDDCKGKWVACSPETVGDFLGRGLLLRPGAAQGTEAADRPDPYVLGRHAGGGLDQPGVLCRRIPISSRSSTHYKEALADYPQAKAKYDEEMDQVEERPSNKAKADGKQPPREPQCPAGTGQPEFSRRPVQRHDRPAGPLYDPGRDLVPGRVERRPGLPVP